MELVNDGNIDTIILMGDMNCDLQIGNNELGKVFYKFDTHQEIKLPTHYSDTAATLINIIPMMTWDLVEDSKYIHPR